MTWPWLAGPSRGVRVQAGFAMAATASFIAATLAVQVLRSDLDWRQATLSQYLMGPYGGAMRWMYVVLALAILIIARVLYRLSSPAARSVAPGLLFVLTAVALATLGIGDGYLPAVLPLWHPFIHGTAAQTALLCVTSAMMLQAWRLRADVRWRRSAGWALLWGGLCFALLWVHVLVDVAGQGWVQKLLILSIVAWLSWMAVLARRDAAVERDAR